MDPIYIALEIDGRYFTYCLFILPKEGVATIIRLFRRESAGVGSGMIEDPGKAAARIREHLDEFGREFKLSGSLFLAATGPDLLCDIEKESVSLSSYRMITGRDCDKVESRIKGRLSSERILIDFVPIEYTPNEHQHMGRRPLGLITTGLSLQAVTISVSRNLLENIDLTAKRAGKPPKGHVAWPLAVSRSTLRPAERQGGVAVVDLGSQSTSLAILLQDHLLQTASYPYGQDAINQDLSRILGLKDDGAAEQIKQRAGLDTDALIESKETLQIVTGSEGETMPYYRKEIARVTYMRLCEIADWVASTIRDSPFRNHVTDGLMLVGEGAGLKGVTDLFSLHTGLPVRVGEIAGLEEKFGGAGNFIYAVVVGVSRYIAEYRARYLKSRWSRRHAA